MATKILVPTPLRPYTDKKDAVDAEGATVGELLADLTARHAGLKAHLYNEQGKLRSFVNVYVRRGHRYLQRSKRRFAGRHGQHHSVRGGRRPGDDRRGVRAPAERELPLLTNDELSVQTHRHDGVGVTGRGTEGREACYASAPGIGSQPRCIWRPPAFRHHRHRRLDVVLQQPPAEDIHGTMMSGGELRRKIASMH